MLSEIERLQKRIKHLEGLLALKQSFRERIPPLETISLEQKATAFDQLYEKALQHVANIASGESRDDDAQYIFEAVMELTLGDRIFKDVINPLLG